MTTLMADCPIHGILPTRGDIDISGGSSNVFVTNFSVQCPKCGASVNTIDSKYVADARGKTRTVLMPTPAQMLRLQSALVWGQQAMQGHADPSVVEAKLRRTVEKEAPGLASMVDAAFGPKGAGVAAWISVLLAVIAIIMSGQQSQMTPEDIVKIVEQVQESERDTPPGPDQPPTKQLPTKNKSEPTESM